MIEEEIVTRVLDDLKILIIGEWSKFYGFYNNFELRKILVVVEAAVAAETIDMEIDAVSRFYLVCIFFFNFLFRRPWLWRSWRIRSRRL